MTDLREKAREIADADMREMWRKAFGPGVGLTDREPLVREAMAVALETAAKLVKLTAVEAGSSRLTVADLAVVHAQIIDEAKRLREETP